MVQLCIFGKNIDPPKFCDYKIILSPVSSKSVSYFNLGISKADNNIEHFSYPQHCWWCQHDRFRKRREKIKNIFVSPDTVSELKSLLGLSLYEKKFKTNGVFDDNKIKKFVSENGIPSFASTSSIGFKKSENYFGAINRSDLIISNLKDPIRNENNDSKIYKRESLAHQMFYFQIKKENFMKKY